MTPNILEYLSLSDRAIFKVVTKSINKKALNKDILVVGPEGPVNVTSVLSKWKMERKKKGIEKKTFITPHSLDC